MLKAKITPLRQLASKRWVIAARGAHRTFFKVSNDQLGLPHCEA
jgi:hypothetical protein